LIENLQVITNISSHSVSGNENKLTNVTRQGNWCETVVQSSEVRNLALFN